MGEKQIWLHTRGSICRKALAGPVDNCTALYVGRLWNHKRVDLIIKAISIVPQGKLIIIGNGAEKRRLKRLVKSLGAQGRVRFLSNLSTAKLNEMYRSVTCIVYTPQREPFGIVPLEAASHGLPVVITQDGGYTEVLDASSAHIVAPEPGRIAEALEALFSDHEAAKRMGAAGRSQVEHYTWDHTARNLLKLFKKTLTNKRKLVSSSHYRPLLGAHYYPWYKAGEEIRHWNENSEYATVTDLPIGGIYSSTDASTISRHLNLAVQAGLDYLVINLQVSSEGLDQNDLVSVDLLFDIAAENFPELSLCFMVSCDNADSRSIDSSLNWLDKNYMSRPNYLCLESKPVLWIFITESFIGHFFHSYTRLFDATRGYQCIAASGFCYSKYLPTHYSEFFNGWSLYSPLQIAASKKWENGWKSSTRDFSEDTADTPLTVFTICPGFDDQSLTHPQRSHSRFRKVLRRGTKTFDRMQEACLNLAEQPDLVVITSFNEFHENTHIEPTENFGHQFIEATRLFSDRLKSMGTKDPRSLADLGIRHVGLRDLG